MLALPIVVLINGAVSKFFVIVPYTPQSRFLSIFAIAFFLTKTPFNSPARPLMPLTYPVILLSYRFPPLILNNLPSELIKIFLPLF